jgi:hypothetical protein
MGTLLRARCECGYETDKIYFGAGMEDCEKCFVPALKNGSSSIEMIDIRKRINHLNYIFYTDKTFYEDELSEFFNAWEFKIKKEKNLCPECKNYKMQFIYRGEFD